MVEVSVVEGASSKAILACSSSSSSPSSSRSGGAAGDNLQSQQRWPQLGQHQLSSDVMGLQGLGVRGSLIENSNLEGLLVRNSNVGDLGLGERSAESARLLLSVSGGEQGDRSRFFPDIARGVRCRAREALRRSIFFCSGLQAASVDAIRNAVNNETRTSKKVRPCNSGKAQAEDAFKNEAQEILPGGAFQNGDNDMVRYSGEPYLPVNQRGDATIITLFRLLFQVND